MYSQMSSPAPRPRTRWLKTHLLATLVLQQLQRAVLVPLLVLGALPLQVEVVVAGEGARDAVASRTTTRLQIATAARAVYLNRWKQRRLALGLRNVRKAPQRCLQYARTVADAQLLLWFHAVLRCGTWTSHSRFWCAAVEGWIVIVTGIHEEAQEDDVLDKFGDYGSVRGINMNLDRRTGFVKGCVLCMQRLPCAL